MSRVSALERTGHAAGLETERARDLASRHGIAARTGRVVESITKLEALGAYVSSVREHLEQSDHDATDSTSAERAKAAEWLLDNHYMVQRSIRQVGEDMPSGFYGALPVLALGASAGLPRIYAVASETQADAGLQPDLPAIHGFVESYQSISRLNMAELWAFPAMLRLTTLEQLVQALSELVPEVTAVRGVEPAVHAEALDLPDRIGRCIRTLRTLNEIDWKAFFLAASEVEDVLRRDPAGVYARMDFDTSDRYRKVVERIARRTGRPESEVASAAVLLARRAPSEPLSAGRRSHVGFYLIEDGRDELEHSLGYQPTLAERFRRRLTKRPALAWLSGIALCTAVALALPCWYLASTGAGPAAWILGTLLALIPASTIGVTVVQWLVTHTLPPRILPKMDFSEGIAEGQRTLVIVPSLLGSLEEAQDLVRQLEIHYTSNPDPELRFALLTDWCDASRKSVPEDDELLERAAAGIELLNARYGREGYRPFHLLHRERLWNPAEGVWMGWERKRGKLEELNALLAGSDDTTFVRHVGDEQGLRGVRYVITLDAGTLMPRDAAARLVGILAHPLNQAEFDPETGAVVRGYTVVQPRVEIAPEGGNLSRFTRVYGGDAAVDLYTLAVSDVYQDLAGCGIYVGKGIYDVAAFTRSLEHRAPENSLVSHDLFEGLHGRVGLASDVLLYEDYPPHYLAFVNRMHRWMRGDWQLLPWLGRHVPSADGGTLPTRFTALGRWMVFDNLRRSLLTPALVLFLVAGWLWLPVEPALWTLLGLLAPAGHMFTGLVAGLIRGGRRVPLRPRAQGLWQSLRENLGRWLFYIAFLPHEALVIADAVMRSMWRVFVSRKHLLEWRTAAHTARSLLGKGPHSLVWSKMFGAPLLALVIAALIAFLRPESLAAAGPLLLIWIASPEIARIASRPVVPHRTEPDAQQRAFLRRLARRTWLFYETFTGPEDNWLPPDNYQEHPGPEIAHRTSPTNVGMLLTSTVSAHTLGYVGSTGLAFRLRSTLDTIERMERYRGHLYNWYDTRTLEPLLPRYVSSVDSGNLAASLLVVQQACAEAAVGPALRPQPWSCLLDTLDLLDETAEGELRVAVRAARERLVALADAEDAHAEELLATWDEVRPTLDHALLDDLQRGQDDPNLGTLRERRTWLDRTQDHVRTLRRELELLTPWIARLASPPELLAGGRAALDEAMSVLRAHLSASPALNELPQLARSAEPLVDRLHRAVRETAEGARREEALAWIDDLRRALTAAVDNAIALRDELLGVAVRCEELVHEHDFGLLYDRESHTFFIGHNVTENRTDPHHYDLLASEARIASVVAIGKGDVPTKHWFHLGRPLTRAAGSPTLLSWSATMFEYLMPSLFAHSNERTLLAQSCRAAVQRQIDYGARNGVPWGISESGFYAFDAADHYQYRAFGCPGLGFKRGLEDDLVIAPYASGLGLLVRPRASCENLQKLTALGAAGPYGMYEAVDFTPRRLPAGRRHAVVKQYMAHHQGMILMAIEHLLCDAPAVRRFHASSLVQTADLLLHERVPVGAAPEERTDSSRTGPALRGGGRPDLAPWVPEQGGRHPELHAVSNGRMTTLVTDSGAGSTSWQGLSLTRWKPDAVLDDSGSWIYVRDEDSGALWSAGRGPVASAEASCQVTFHPHLVELHRRDHGVFVRTEIAVAPREDVEVRHLTVTNETDARRTLSFTSCAELALNTPGDDRRHPAFARLFAPATVLPGRNALLFERRLRSTGQDPCALLHRIVAENGVLSRVGCETDRGRFVGRLSSWSDPAALRPGRRLPKLREGPAGSLDPLIALSGTITVGPFETVRLAFVTAVAGSRETVLEIGDRFRSLSSIEWILQDAQSESAREAQVLGCDATHLPTNQALLSMLLQPAPALRGAAELIAKNRLGRPALWGHGISGDLPILLCELRDRKDVQIARRLLVAHHLWRRRGIGVALVFNVHGAGGYGDEETGAVHRLIVECGAEAWVGRRAGVFVLRGDQMPVEDRHLLHAVARVVLDSSRGTLEEQLADRHAPLHELPPFVPALAGQADPGPTPALERPTDLLLDNGLGGFSADGRDYVVHLEDNHTTPAPWCNVIANPDFGTIVTESSLGYTWCKNSAENRLTPWSNDPALDPCGEALYLRDEETAAVWSATPAPAGRGADYTTRHTAGGTTWLHNRHGLEHETRAFVAREDPVKVVAVRLRNVWDRRRRLTLTFYAEWVLGLTRAGDPLCVIPEHDHETGALLARNPWNDEHPERVAFLSASLPPHGVTVDRGEFLGRDGDRARPAALERWGLSGRLQADADPCAALMVYAELEPGEEKVVWFVLGQGANRDEAVALAHRYAVREHMERAGADARSYWDTLLGAVEVKTPEPAMDLVLNRWLLYEAVSGRLFARSGFYQSSGAFGFRDQLQDVMSLAQGAPELLREHILRAAASQFEEGDVLHWWHPTRSGRRGVRTRCSDDLLWLPLAVSHYVRTTGDATLLDDKVPFLTGAPLAEGEGERYECFETADTGWSVLEHCRRALERGWTAGRHGLPLIGTCDWNDGLSRVGEEGRGESVWMGWFLHHVTHAFAALIDTEEPEQAAEWRRRAERLRQAIETSAWDGSWYLRAWFDDGTPLGSSRSEECRIDAIAQSWAAISGAGDPERTSTALESAWQHLVREDDGIVLLLTPPFERCRPDPGYIRSYPPGVRENGGQYTHAACWLGWAYAAAGEGARAETVFRLLNPALKGASADDAQHYRVEPYVIAADVYGAPPHVGRGGWTWYTGAAAWAWRLGVEAILGLSLEAGDLVVDPCIPPEWPGFEATVRRGACVLHVRVENEAGVARGVAAIELDGQPFEGSALPLADLSGEHEAVVRLG